MAYEDLEQRYSDSLVPGLPQPPAPQPFSSQAEEQQFEERAQEITISEADPQPLVGLANTPTMGVSDNCIDLEIGVAQFQGINLVLPPEDVAAICKILASRVVVNLSELSKTFTTAWIDPPADEKN